MDRIPVREAARGRWPGILPAFGLSAKALSGKHGPCPLCRSGKDCFRFDNLEGRGTWICSKCNAAGDGVALVMGVTGKDFKDAAVEIERLAGVAPVSVHKPTRTADDVRSALRRLWAAAGPVVAGDPVSLWLERRVGLRTVPRCLRSAARLRYDGDSPTYHPGMVAVVRGFDEKSATLHRTFLTRDGQKAPVSEPRMFMPGGVPLGAAVRLFPPAESMGIAEGIETAFAAASLFGIPVWSALNAGNLAKWKPPVECCEVVIFGDNDLNGVGQKAAWALVERLAVSGHAWRVEIPPVPGEDWNDVLLKANRHAA